MCSNTYVHRLIAAILIYIFGIKKMKEKKNWFFVLINFFSNIFVKTFQFSFFCHLKFFFFIFEFLVV